MIARTWRARAAAAKAPTYAKHFSEVVAPHLKDLAGYEGAWLLQREVGGKIEFVAVTLWESRKVIEAFAGKDISRSHVEPEGQAALESFDDFAEHYEVAYSG